MTMQSHPSTSCWYRVAVGERRNPVLVGDDGASYLSPPQPEGEARALAGLLAGHSLAGDGPWCQPVAGGQRTIELRPEP